MSSLISPDMNMILEKIIKHFFLYMIYQNLLNILAKRVFFNVREEIPIIFFWKFYSALFVNKGLLIISKYTSSITGSTRWVLKILFNQYVDFFNL